MAVDQYTYNVVMDIANRIRANVLSTTIIQNVIEVKIIGGSLTMGSIVDTMPRDLEIKVKSFVNCTSNSRKWAEERTIDTFEKVELTIENELTTTSTGDINLSVDWKALKLGAGLKQEDVARLKQTRHYQSETKTNEKLVIDEEVPARTALYLKASIKSGFVKASLVGNVMIDALVHVKGHMPGVSVDRHPVWLSNSFFFTQLPSDRTVPYNGYITSETFSHIEKAVIETPLTDDDPRCSIDVLDAEETIIRPSNLR